MFMIVICLAILISTLNFLEHIPPYNLKKTDYNHSYNKIADFGAFCSILTSCVELYFVFQYLTEFINGNSSQPELDIYHIIGVLVSCGGHLLIFICQRTLRNFYTHKIGIVQNHKLIQTGPYKFLKHPSYLGTLMVGTGSMVFHKSTVLMFLHYIYYSAAVFPRIKEEEKMLRKHFKGEYEEFEKSRWRLIPFIY